MSYQNYDDYHFKPANDGPSNVTPMVNNTLMGRGHSQAAGPWRRLGAFFLDTIVVSIVIAVILLTVTTPETQSDLRETVVTVNFYSTIALWLYMTLCQMTGFQTLGKRITGIRAVDMQGNLLGFIPAALRNFWILLALIPAIGGNLQMIVGVVIFVVVFAGDKTQGLNDKWSKTQVLTR